MNGAWQTSQIAGPIGVAADHAGNVLVASNNCRLQKVLPDGSSAPLATQSGECTFGVAFRLTVDSGGNVFVTGFADGFVTVYKVTPAGVVSKLVTGNALSDLRSLGRDASYRPFGVAFDSAGNVYVASSTSHQIKKISPSGDVTAVAGAASNFGFADGIGTQARFSAPSGLAADSSGALYIADSNNCAIRKIMPDGQVTTLAGGTCGYGDGQGSAAKFGQPEGVAVDAAGVVYVADTNNHVVRKITPTGLVSTVAGRAGQPGSADGVADGAHFKFPEDVSVGADGSLYVADRDNNAIRRVSASGQVSTFAGVPLVLGFADGAVRTAVFNQPQGIGADAQGNLYVADTLNHVIRKVDRAGTVTTVAGRPGVVGSDDGEASQATFGYPMDIAVDAAGNIYVADASSQLGIPVFPESLTLERARGTPALIRKITPEGLVTTVAGGSQVSSIADGVGASAGFGSPLRITSDAQGTLYVAEPNTVRKVTPDGTVTTIAGVPGQPLNSSPDSLQVISVHAEANGDITVLAFGQPIRSVGATKQLITITPAGQRTVVPIADISCAGSLARDQDQTIYSGGRCISKIAPDGSSTTIAGFDAGGIAGSLGPIPGTNLAGDIAFVGPKRLAALTPGGVLEIVLP